MVGMSSPEYPGQAQRRPNAVIQQVKLTPDRFTFELPVRGWITQNDQTGSPK